MKKIASFLALAVSVAVVVSVYAESTKVKNTGAGYQIGSSVTQKVGFFGATPVVRQTITNTAPILIQVIAVDGSTNTIAVYTTTNQLNQVRTALVNLGIASTNGK